MQSESAAAPKDARIGRKCNDAEFPHGLESLNRRRANVLRRGVEAWKQAAAGFLAAFPDIQFTVDEHVVSGDTAFYRWHATGTHNGPFGPLPATGKRVAFNGLLFDRVSNGRVVERWEQFDQPAILRQLGVG